MKKVSLADLRAMLTSAEAAEVSAMIDMDFDGRARARDDVRRLKARINRRERDEAMRSIGMVRVRGGLGGTYWE